MRKKQRMEKKAKIVKMMMVRMKWLLSLKAIQEMKILT